MPIYKTPGNYIEEKNNGSRPVEGSSQGVAAFIGCAEKGPIGKATLVTSFKEFVSIFGSYIAESFLAYSVENFFIEAGQGAKLYVVRTAHYTDITDASTLTVKNSFLTVKTAAVDTFKMTAIESGVSTLSIAITDPTVADVDKFKLEIFDGSNTTPILTLDNQTTDLLNGTTQSGVTFEKLATGRPVNTAKTLLSGYDNGLTGLTDSDYTGSSVSGTGLFALDEVDENLNICIPGITSVTVITAVAAYAASNRHFNIVEVPLGLTYAEAKDFKLAAGTYSTGVALDSKFQAIYYPWYYIKDPVTGGKKLLPPSGSMAGVYARVAGARGCHKAPAGIEDGKLLTAIGVERIVTDTQQSELNPIGVNVIRSFSDAGIVAWGARTTSTDSDWKYINVRLHRNFVASSLQKGTRWAVFEPNDEATWSKVRLAANSFLNKEWKKGAFNDGGTNNPANAYYVVCDETVNTQAEIDAGEMHMEIGVAESKPGEFLIIGISQWDGGRSITES